MKFLRNFGIWRPAIFPGLLIARGLNGRCRRFGARRNALTGHFGKVSSNGKGSSHSGTGTHGPPIPPKSRWLSLGTGQGSHPDTVGDTHSQNPLESTPNPGLQNPRFAIPEGLFSEYVPKTIPFYTHFQENNFACDLSQTERFASNYKTLIDAFGRQNSAGVGG